MKSRIGLLSLAVLAGLWATAAIAAVGATSQEAQKRPQGDTLQLAQRGDVEIYFDGNGNRVIVDSYTGEIIAVQPPRSAIGRQGERRAARQRDRYYLDDSYEVERLPRDYRQYQDRYPEPPVDDTYQDYSRAPGLNDFPPPPGRFPDDEALPRDGYGQRQNEEPQVVRREPVTRAPLGDPLEAAPQETTPDTVIETPPATGKVIAPAFTAREDVAALQILLDRAGASPGVIDGRFGSNVDKALIAYRDITGANLKSTDTADIKDALAATGGDPFIEYTITPEDAAGPFVASVPADYSQKAQLDHLSFTSVTEMLAERFHMDETYLKALNPEANFNRPGTIIRVANTGRKATTKVARIIADKGLKQVRAYDESGKLVVAYPATIGSADTPSPTGIHAVSRVALNPNYTYNPKLNFKQGNNDKILTIPPGPNGPVGTVWIALDKPTYGIHGTPDPSKIGKTESHGCVRLTNWDAEELTKLVSPGVPVEFVE
ncbi:L,D-transpeptidase family protein [Pseudaminobacter salicylatoxidans]|uniref:L,D-transpeptidase family protein n=1 Tax=Pseudaminobacter salicylatoxidans TaxID=93369 RepID=UPI0002FB5123|nr:L,D-transpeptidase family protein [Pseudaminobacter salicylatoxidans]